MLSPDIQRDIEALFKEKQKATQVVRVAVHALKAIAAKHPDTAVMVESTLIAIENIQKL
jgi:hypothetical protein